MISRLAFLGLALISFTAGADDSLSWKRDECLKRLSFILKDQQIYSCYKAQSIDREDIATTSKLAAASMQDLINTEVSYLERNCIVK